MNIAYMTKMRWTLNQNSSNLWFQVIHGNYDRRLLSKGNVDTKPTNSFNKVMVEESCALFHRSIVKYIQVHDSYMS